MQPGRPHGRRPPRSHADSWPESRGCSWWGAAFRARPTWRRWRS